MTKLTAVVIVGGSLVQCDVIEFDGKRWLVPNWLDFPDQGFSIPERIVLLDLIQHQQGAGPNQLVVNGSIPKAVFEGPVPSKEAGGYVVIQRPDIRVPLPGKTH